MESTGTTFTMLWDPTFESWSQLGISGQPAGMLLDANGTILTYVARRHPPKPSARRHRLSGVEMAVLFLDFPPSSSLLSAFNPSFGAIAEEYGGLLVLSMVFAAVSISGLFLVCLAACSALWLLLFMPADMVRKRKRRW